MTITLRSINGTNNSRRTVRVGVAVCAMPLVLRAKCVVVGDAAVGKSALVQSFVSDGTKFPKNYFMTTGVDIVVKAVTVPDTDTTVELYIYDSAGKEVFADYIPQYWDSPGLVVVVYDVSVEQSFDSCVKWLERVRAQKPAVETQLPGVLVACKCDLPTRRREVSEERGRELAASKDLQYFETSVKEHQCVEEPFLYLASQYYQLYQQNVVVLQEMTSH